MKASLKQESNLPIKIPKKLSRKSKMTIAILVLLFLGAMTTITVLLMKYYEPHVEINHSARVTMPDGSNLALYTLSLVDRSFIGENQNVTAFLTFSQEKYSRILQQSKKSNFFLHTMDYQKGINVKMNQQSNTSLYVKQDTFVDYVIQQSLKNGQPDKDTPQLDIKKTGTSDDYFAQLNYVFTKAVEETTGEKSIQVKFSNLTMARVKINDHIGGLEFDTSSSKRLLTQQERRLFLGKLFGVVKSIVPKVAGFLVNTVRKYGPLIGKVAGGVVGGVGGFITGGPIGAFQGAMTGMEIGGMIGSAASSLVNACIPQGKLTISCTPSSLTSVMSQFGTSSMPGLVDGFSQFASNFGSSAFGNFGGGMGNLINRIPFKSLSNFGFGNLFSKG